MARRPSIQSQLLAMQRQQRQAERAALAHQRFQERTARQMASQNARDHISMQEERAAEQTTQLEQRFDELTTVLIEGLRRDPSINFNRLKVSTPRPPFDSLGLDKIERRPSQESFAPKPLSFWQQLIPPMVENYRKRVAEADVAYQNAMRAAEKREANRAAELAANKERWARECEQVAANDAKVNAEIDEFAESYKAANKEAVVTYFSLVLSTDKMPELFSDTGDSADRVTYAPESRQLVIERRLPTLDIIPPYTSYRYIKKVDAIEPVARRPAEIRAAYTGLLAQVSLRTLWAVAWADSANTFDTVVFNGFVDTTDPATGRRVTPMLISVSASKDALKEISFDKVDASACLRNLKALVSRNAHDLEPVRPIVSFDMVDKRFIDSSDVLSTLDTRPNLAELTPQEFEALMTNLFQKMGLETRLTQASRDGGVDCVAWDMRPVIGGKVVIQAKRYKNTVGVSAVRDLFGTMLNEGAAKGILVTTSGYGPSAYEFAKNKPIELITGSNLLSLLQEHAEINARVEFPNDWHDAQEKIDDVSSQTP